MSGDAFDDRRAALEEAFFARQSALLRQQLRDAGDARARREALSAASGISDAALIQTLVDLDISTETLMALSLVPLVAVAWADGSVDDAERREVFSRAAAKGIGIGDLGHKLFEGWLAAPPPPEMFAAWKAYIGAMSAALPDHERATLKRELLEHATAVAKAAGGFMKVGRKISSSEDAVLREIDGAFGP